ncbi:MAG: TonB-dependent receptor [Paucibacter sp.]|nr:TonB-dependent receptor [Roseateles sp.]
MTRAFSLRRKPLASAAASALALLACTAVQAQSADGATVENLGTVEVSGQSRVQQLQNVPITMQVLGAETLKAVGATNLASMNGFVPGLSVDDSQPTQPGYSLRGLGSGDFGIGTDSPVGVYVNGVYTGKTGGALLNFNDLKRVEVLEGPQGTLFGRNSAGGAISIVQNDPSGVTEASALVRFGNQGTRHVEGLYNTPLSDSVALRISAVGQFSDGWVTNHYDGSKAGGRRDWGTRSSLRWSGDDTTAVLSWEHEQLNEKARPIWAYNTTPATLANPSQWIDPRKADLNEDTNPNVESRRFDGVTLRVEHSLPFAEFTSTTAWRHFNSVNAEDNDGTGNIASYLSTGNFEHNTTYQQEFKLNGHNALVDWVAGASGFWEQARQTSTLVTTTNTLDPILFATGMFPTPMPPMATLGAGAQQLGQALGLSSLMNTNLVNGQTWTEGMNNTGSFKSFALFGDAIWHLGASDEITTGLRLTRDQKSFSWYSPLRQAPAFDAQLNALAGTLQQLLDNPMLAAAAPQVGQLLALAQGLQSVPNIEFTNAEAMAGTLRANNSWTNTSPRLVYTHHLNAEHMVYASWTKGYQSGGFPILSAPVGGAVPKYSPENVTSVELGAKGQFKAAGLFYGATLFHYNFTNLQSLTFNQATGSQIAGTYDISTSDQKATGMDLNLQWRPDRVWTVHAALEYIDQTYGKYSKSDTDFSTGQSVALNLDGKPTGTPKLGATVGADGRWVFGDGRINAGVQGGYTSATRCNADIVLNFGCVQTAAFRIGGPTSRVDAHLGWEPASQKWGVGLIVNNLANQRYVGGPSTSAAQLGALYGSATPPRTAMVEFSAKL